MLWEPLIYLNTTEKLTLAVGLTWFQTTQIGNMPKTHLMLAYSIMMTAAGRRGLLRRAALLHPGDRLERA